jgi:hypothetical protein
MLSMRSEERPGHRVVRDDPAWCLRKTARRFPAGQEKRAGRSASQGRSTGLERPVTDTPAMPRISDLGQHRQQARRVFSAFGETGEMADGRVNR